MSAQGRGDEWQRWAVRPCRPIERENYSSGPKVQDKTCRSTSPRHPKTCDSHGHPLLSKLLGFSRPWRTLGTSDFLFLHAMAWSFLQLDQEIRLLVVQALKLIWGTTRHLPEISLRDEGQGPENDGSGLTATTLCPTGATGWPWRRGTTLPRSWSLLLNV
jgi:hypothetical protein